MNILTKIVAQKKQALVQQKLNVPISTLERSQYFETKVHSISEALKAENASGIIAEFKRSSPSKGLIKVGEDSIETITQGYVAAGANALSVLTDTPFFAGTNEDFLQARAANQVPMLRKDFMVDEYQIIEAKSLGADVILLIAACLSVEETKGLGKLANSLEMEVLLEVHNEEELSSHLNEFIQLVGVNNRNLKTFEVDINTSKKLVDQIPNQFVKISESGIQAAQSVEELRAVGYSGFLMGTHFMGTLSPHKSCEVFIQSLSMYSA